EVILEAGCSQWCWGAPAGPGKYLAIVFTDPLDAHAGKYAGLIERVTLLNRRLGGGGRGRVIVREATAFLDRSPVGSNFLKVGDSAITIDPLSSQGLQVSIGTALHAAVVIHTMIDRPEDGELAMEFYRARLRESAEFHARAAAQFYSEQ